MPAHTSLTGSWSGAYRYPPPHDRETIFEAQIDEVDGAFIGATQEPNEFLSNAGAVLTAEIEGARTGQSVWFTKFYSHSGVRHAVRYEGAADANLTRIDGAWRIPGDWSGTFFMIRDDCSAAIAFERVAVEPVGANKS